MPGNRRVEELYLVARVNAAGLVVVDHGKGSGVVLDSKGREHRIRVVNGPPETVQHFLGQRVFVRTQFLSDFDLIVVKYLSLPGSGILPLLCNRLAACGS